MSITSFPSFARLPTELRHAIWHEFLLPYDKPTVYLYNKNFFLKHLDPDGEDERYTGISHTPTVEVDMPASLHVNAESRAATLGWSRLRGIKLRYRQETKGHILTRAFDPQHDALYVSRDKWEEFCEFIFDEDALVESSATEVRHLAFPAFTAYYSFTELGSLMVNFPLLESLSAVWGQLPELKYARTRRFPRRQYRQQHLLSTDDDGTDTGVDPATGELEERIAAEVQPRWVLEEESREMVRMCVRDPLDDSESWEDGELQMWMEELKDAMLTLELPEHVYDVEEERFLVEFRAVKAVRESVG